ncbi:MAG TPA: efflux RND transporter periplasmic adaptor subunit [bacterium]|nr:efflux RND transporter periplasmic adaptor subunit [bacterium]HPN45499.1 efflux RND transporter periplasmic adaptor subunit [bacterium]
MKRGLWFFIPLLIYSCSPREEAEQSVSGLEAAQTSVRIDSAFTGTLIMQASASGLCRAVESFSVRPRVTGIVKRCPVKDGQFVQKEEVLLELAADEYKNQYEQVRASFMKTSIDYGRMRGERVSGAKSNLLDLEQAKENYEKAARSGDELEIVWSTAEYEVAKMFSNPNKEQMLAFQSGLLQSYYQLKKAEFDYNNCIIKAPFSGVIGGVSIQAGDPVSPGTECFQLLNLDQVIVEVGLLESEINTVKPGNDARVSLTAVPQTFTSKVQSVSPIVDRKNRTCAVQILVNNPQRIIKDGMYASVKIDADKYSNLLLVPKEAILERDNGKLLFIVREERAVWCYVETGRENGQYVEICSSKFDLKPGEPVIIDGHFTLAHDAQVKITQE